MTPTDDEMAQVLKPVAPPRVLEGVYTDDQYERLWQLIKDKGPWPTITAHHFDTVEELVATTSGPMRAGEGGVKLTLDDIATGHFRGYLANGSTCFHPEIEDIFYNHKFLDLVRDYWGAELAQPTHMLFNLCGPHHTGLSPHLDAVQFRGVRMHNSPVWLQNVMGKSGLFQDYMVKMAQVIAWWYRGENGTFTYWPDGPLRSAEGARAPALEQGRRRAERGDVPPRRPRRPSRGPRHPRPEAPVDARLSSPTATTGPSRPTARSSAATSPTRCASSCTGAPSSTPTGPRPRRPSPTPTT